LLSQNINIERNREHQAMSRPAFPPAQTGANRHSTAVGARRTHPQSSSTAFSSSNMKKTLHFFILLTLLKRTDSCSHKQLSKRMM
jgi:hypothetical protein